MKPFSKLKEHVTNRKIGVPLVASIVVALILIPTLILVLTKDTVSVFTPSPASQEPSEEPSKEPVQSTQDQNEQTSKCCSGNRVSYTLGVTTIDDFGYYIQSTRVAKVASSQFDLVIIDYSRDGSEDTEFTPAQVASMKGSDKTKKILLAYVSIGEAEDYRYYWDESWYDSPPYWLGEENPDWDGNYKVQYWDENWQAIVFAWLDKIIDVRFDGIYCDIIDAYQYYEVQGRGTAAYDMVEFVSRLSTYVKQRAGEEFFVFVQNGSDLLNDPSYRNVIDGIGQEDLFYDGNSRANSIGTARIVENLNVAKEDGKVILVTDYIPTSREEQTCQFYIECEVHGYLCHTARRDLKTLRNNTCYPAT